MTKPKELEVGDEIKLLESYEDADGFYVSRQEIVSIDGDRIELKPHEEEDCEGTWFLDRADVLRMRTTERAGGHGG